MEFFTAVVTSVHFGSVPADHQIRGKQCKLRRKMENLGFGKDGEFFEMNELLANEDPGRDELTRRTRTHGLSRWPLEGSDVNSGAREALGNIGEALQHFGKMELFDREAEITRKRYSMWLLYNFIRKNFTQKSAYKIDYFILIPP